MAKVLVVDDDQAMLDIIDLWLTSEGHSVTQALDGKLALKSISNEDFDVMITDLVMPETEGITLIRETRLTHKDMKILAISGGGKGGINYLDAARKLGADNALSKPLTQSGVVDAVNALLRH